MNVMRVYQAVIKRVLILMVVILVHALMAMSLMLMVIVVMASIVHITLCNNCFLSDVDECSEDIDGCQVHCSNTIGSYNCYCDNGYELLNSTHCTGTLYSMMKCNRLHTCL